MRIFLFEFITGGGLIGQPLPPSLTAEGELMVQALLDDLLQLETDEIVVCRDHRLSNIERDVTQKSINSPNIDAVIDLIKTGDVVWLIAPETDQCLETLTASINALPVQFIGCNPEAVKIASSKMKTYEVLSRHGVPTIETTIDIQTVRDNETGWIMKPDDGAGADDIHVITDKKTLVSTAEQNKTGKYVIQPYIDGVAMSLSVICWQGKAVLLACNRQYIESKNNGLKLTAIGVNECLQESDAVQDIVNSVARSLPGLNGYIGIDIVKFDKQYLVVEINPRMTTAYAGLSVSLNQNVAEMILNTFINKELPSVDLGQAKLVRIPV